LQDRASIRITGSILRRLMDTAIQLNNQVLFKTYKIGDILVNNMLSPELKAVQLAVP